ncbi:hypothetical protein DPMN_011468 [Dreissena polymorpha]|uniref:Uncharacterized protein n=1 Tax=Dreissena polymorpha TaxID=45954 RepID=A0A9D4N3P2_DREPO|nr:hypothetical protein DPMN_011468 [Dreissena polymorpha]
MELRPETNKMTKQMYTTDFGIKTKYRYLLRGENECAALNYKINLKVLVQEVPASGQVLCIAVLRGRHGLK